ncbi:SUMO-conjugating enzyme SCE1 [Capsicum annuum]|uniref:SUMO-conjugating enzyme SCE1 n=1 Tax=Capsicum annuum TaxID=4072 RepID=A0A2G2YBB3_CAPAN|nr:SUMO-conjugating enzyme SCE1 [Capsicum annuum]PHT66979.1 SUMO-conjugating enzyme SCE1 [Capsicum annuum]
MSMKVSSKMTVSSQRRSSKTKRRGFVATPVKTGSDPSSVNLMEWSCYIPGKAGTDWEGASYPITMLFSEDYPNKPPTCKFPEGFFHPNVYPSGMISIDILDEDREWDPDLTIEEILSSIQDFLDNPNPYDPTQDAYYIFSRDQDAYNKRVRQQVEYYASLPPP